MRREFSLEVFQPPRLEGGAGVLEPCPVVGRLQFAHSTLQHQLGSPEKEIPMLPFPPPIINITATNCV